ncbi:hypothetical protein POV27_04600 [Aureisphaera galaxeae]|uniref:hypothetical protein n=1 Tax=Aureisphaera galaxeae TaxID=1538023 RepID=UPI00234FFB23|nr:hypothetical protein [Aureisphaera galaxeae]MDC8003317.1 hypothetical protein [Aureisphaera galaxeae]
MKKLFIASLLILTSFHAMGQWSKGKGNGFYKLSAWYLQSDQHYTDTGRIDPNVTRTQFNLSFYGEYGVSESLDLVGYIPFYARAAQNNILSETTGNTIQEGEAINSIGDIDLGVNYRFFQKNKWSASARLLLGLPTGENSGGSDGSFQTGDGEFNQYLSALLGYSTTIGDLPFYAKGYFGFNNRTEGFSDELRFGVESGINLFNKKFWILGKANISESLQNGNLSARNSPQGSIFANNIEFFSLGVEASYLFTDNIGVSVGFDSAVSGRIIAANPSFTAGVFLDIK